MSTGEDSLVGWLRGAAAGLGGESIGDDAAFVRLSGSWAITVDTQIADVHVPANLDPAVLARRLLAVNLSDLAAVGAVPKICVLSLAAPAGFRRRPFFRALLRACRRHDLQLVGGDLAQSTTVTASLTLLGRRRGRRWLERRGARPGDRIWVGGSVGDSALGCRLVNRGARIEKNRVELRQTLAKPRQPAARRCVRRHLLPEPQLELSAALVSMTLPKGKRIAAIDLSDGLARDLHRLCRESGVGAEIETGSLPSLPGAPALAQTLNLDWLDLQLGGGEDYRLLFTLPEDTEPPASVTAQAIGKILATSEITLRRGAEIRPLPPLGWDHLESSS